MNQDAFSIPKEGFLRLRQVLEIIPVSRATWFRGVAAGLYPRGVKLGQRATGYRAEDIRALLERLGRGEGVAHE